MTRKYDLICMSFDGEFKKERFQADSIDGAWSQADDLGSKWFFYPFYFVVSESGKTIADAPFPLELLKGKRVKSVVKLFHDFSITDEAKNMDSENYAFSLPVI